MVQLISGYVGQSLSILCCRTQFSSILKGKEIEDKLHKFGPPVVKRPFLINSFCFKIRCTLSKFSTSQVNFYLRSDIKFTKFWNDNALHNLFFFVSKISWYCLIPMWSKIIHICARRQTLLITASSHLKLVFGQLRIMYRSKIYLK